jgi:hypothetical protein
MLSVSETVSSSFTDSRAALMTYRSALYICLALAALAGLLGMFFPMGSQDRALVAAVSSFYYVIVLAVVLSYFGLAAAVRTIRPDFRMTAGRFFGVLIYGLAVGIAVEIAAFFLLIPGIWIGAKLSLTIPMYLLYPDEVFGKSWSATTYRFWPTLGLVIVTAIITAVLAGIASVAAVGIIMVLPLAAIVLAPLALLVFAFVQQFHWLALVRWSQNLVEHPASLAPVPGATNF